VRQDTAVRLVMVAGVVLMLDLLFAPWYDQAFFGGGYTVTRTALEPPQGWLAVLAWLGTGALLVEVVLSRISGLPRLVVPWARIQTVQGATIFGFVVLKFLVTRHYAWGSWLGVLLAGALAYGAWVANHEPAPNTGGARHE
jgi:hypothetical protein